MNEKMEKHLTVLGILFLISSTILLIVGLSISIGVPMIISYFENGFTNNMLHNVSYYIGTILIILAIPGYIGAYGLFKQLWWGRIFSIIICILSLFSVLFGTCMGVYGLYVLMQDETIVLFDNKKK